VKLSFILKWLLILVGVFVIITTMKFILVIGLLALLVMLFFATRDKIRAGVEWLKFNTNNIFK
jgi:uncharacterized Tic20 family protein